MVLLLGLPVAAQSLACNLKLPSAVTEAQEAENPQQQANGLSADVLDSTNLLFVSHGQSFKRPIGLRTSIAWE